jgi:hypothetical protein
MLMLFGKEGCLYKKIKAKSLGAVVLSLYISVALEQAVNRGVSYNFW